MDLVEVEITGQAITARYGTLTAGDILRTDKEFAAHLVNDCGAAKYVVAKVKKPAAPPAAKAKEKAAKPRQVAPASDSADVCTDPPAGGPAGDPATAAGQPGVSGTPAPDGSVGSAPA